MTTLKSRSAIVLRLSLIAALTIVIYGQTNGTFAMPGWANASQTDSRRVIYPPLTGKDLAEFLNENESHLRRALTDFDKTLDMAHAIGDQAVFTYLQQQHRTLNTITVQAD